MLGADRAGAHAEEDHDGCSTAGRAENLPNEPDLDRSGHDGCAQWADVFHDKVKALLTDGPWDGQDATPDRLVDAVYFSRQSVAAHTIPGVTGSFPRWRK